MNKHRKMTNCPSCSSNKISYDIKLEKLICNHCGHKIETIKAEKKIKEIDTLQGLVINEQTKLIHKSKSKLQGIMCKCCGAIKYVKDINKYTGCRLCGRKEYELVDKTTFEEPKYILPFLLNKKEAYSKHKNLDINDKFSDKEFLNNFKEENLIGVYIPYRIENNKYICALSGEGYATYYEYHYKDDDEYKTVKYVITRDVEVTAKDIYYERADKDIFCREDMLENIITEISPYDMKEKIELRKEYLEEYIIIKPNETPVSDNTKKNKLTNIAKYAVLEDILKYDYGVIWNGTNCKVLETTNSYVYLPVWLYYKADINNGKVNYYYIAINGRTGEIGMQLPLNNVKAIISSLLIALVSTTLITSVFSPFFLYVIAMIGIFNVYIFFGVLIYIVIFIVIYKNIYNDFSNQQKGKKVIHENDRNIDYQGKIIARSDKKITNRVFYSEYLYGRNDNFYD